jgi:hypothetical protein
MTRPRISLAATILALALAAVVGGCDAAPASSGGEAGVGSIRPADASALRYTCGKFPFGPDILTRVGQAELADNPEPAALRAHLAQEGPDIDFLPDGGWILAGIDATSAEYVTVGGDLGMKTVTLDAEGAAWRVTGWGDCQARRVLPAGLGDADWVLAPDQPPIGPETRSFDVLVTERSCASGQSSEGRIAGPDILEVNDLLLVTFAVRPLEGDQNCPSNPATRVTVDLGEPLGDRTLRDGGALPPRDPAVAP